MQLNTADPVQLKTSVLPESVSNIYPSSLKLIIHISEDPGSNTGIPVSQPTDLISFAHEPQRLQPQDFKQAKKGHQYHLGRLAKYFREVLGGRPTLSALYK